MDSATIQPQVQPTIMSSCVKGTDVYDHAGERLGQIEELVVDKLSGSVVFAIVGSEEFFGIRERFRPVPWSLLDYDISRASYVVPLLRAVFDAAPRFRLADLTGEARAWQQAAITHYRMRPAGSA